MGAAVRGYRQHCLSAHNQHGRAVPVTDGESVWALFASGDLACLDRDGNLQWVRALVRDYPAVSNTTGMAASLVMCGDILIVPLENAGESLTVGLDAKTGKNRWKIERPRATTG